MGAESPKSWNGPRIQRQTAANAQDDLSQEALASYEKAEEMIASIGRYNIESDSSGKVLHIEHRSDAETGALSNELHDLLANHFVASENMDPMQHEIGIRNRFTDVYVTRDEQGKLASAMCTATLNLPSEDAKPGGIGLITWYVARHPEHKGPPVAPALYQASLRTALAEARRRKVPFECVLGETEPEVEKMLNTFGRTRLYYERSDGAIAEIPYESPPEDESGEGVPCHLMGGFFTNPERTPASRIVDIVQTIHAEYTRKEYFTSEYLKFAQDWYNKSVEADEQDTTNIDYSSAEQHYEGYGRIVNRIQDQFKARMAGVTNVFPLSQSERFALVEQGKTVIDWGNVANPKLGRDEQEKE